MTTYVSTSGWQYRDWRRRFYPAALPQARWLEHFAERFAAVEVNNTFYRLPERHTFEDWAARTPDDFLFVCKISRYLSHVKRLRDPGEAVARFLDRSAGLGAKRGPVLLQLPPTMKRETARLADSLDAVAGATRVAVEFRHESWFDDEVYSVLADRGATLCLTDRDSRVLGPVVRTAPWGYLRMHAGRATPRPCYGRAALSHWAERLAELWGDGETYVFFNNDTRGCAVRDAVRFARSARRAGLVPTRVPAGGEVWAGAAKGETG